MNETPKTKGEAVIERLMQELDPASDRYHVLETAKRFKSSWVELGEKLLAVQSHQLYQQWGYGSFEEYCSQEVRIKKPTAQKLTLAFRYLEKEEPQLLAKRSELKPLPDYRSIDLLRQAREEKGFSDEEYADLRKSVLEEERSHPTVLKKFREVAAESSEEPKDQGKLLKAALTASRKLDSALQELAELPEAIRPDLQQLSAWLEAEFETIRPPE